MVLATPVASSLSLALLALSPEDCFACVRRWLRASLLPPAESASSPPLQHRVLAHGRKRRRVESADYAADRRPLLHAEAVCAAVRACTELVQRQRAHSGVVCRGRPCVDYRCSLHLLLCSDAASASSAPALLDVLLSSVRTRPSLVCAALRHVHDLTETQLVAVLHAALDVRLAALRVEEEQQEHEKEEEEEEDEEEEGLGRREARRGALGRVGQRLFLDIDALMSVAPRIRSRHSLLLSLCPSLPPRPL